MANYPRLFFFGAFCSVNLIAFGALPAVYSRVIDPESKGEKWNLLSEKHPWTLLATSTIKVALGDVSDTVKTGYNLPAIPSKSGAVINI